MNHLFQIKLKIFFKKIQYKYYNFIETSPSTWENNLEDKRGKEIISQLKVVNDTAERAVKLIEDFNKIGSKNEEQKQYILQVVTEYGQQYSNSNKSTLLEKL